MAANEFVILPRSGLFSAGGSASDTLLRALPQARSTLAPMTARSALGPNRDVNVIDSVRENGPKLVRLDDAAAQAANAPSSPVRALPVVVYELPRLRAAAPLAAPAGAGHAATIEVVEAATGAPLAGADVIAFDSFAAKTGDQGVTDSAGRVVLRLGAPAIDRLYVYTATSHWGAFRSGIAITPGALRVPVQRVALPYVDGVRRYYAASRFNPGTGVTVGVIDTGVGPHPDLRILSGRNTVTGEPAGDFADWHGHGTHVAGLVGASGGGATGVRGVAPGIGIRAYRVFGNGAGGATNYAILKAMIMAATDGCDIINLSLGGGPYDAIVEEAIGDARQNGMLVVVAAGNDGRKPVSYPAAYAGATAVSALGHEATYPADAVAAGDVDRPPTSPADPKEFIAGFSNVGPQIAVTAPGVGVLSTLRGGGIGPMSGTSMAAPVAAGAAASLLSQKAAIWSMPRGPARSAAIETLLQTSCVRRGFTPIFVEGFGLPDPAKV